MVNSIPHFYFRFQSRETASLFLYERSKIISFYIPTERTTNTVTETMDFEEAAISSARSALTSGSREEELLQPPWTN